MLLEIIGLIIFIIMVLGLIKLFNEEKTSDTFQIILGIGILFILIALAIIIGGFLFLLFFGWDSFINLIALFLFFYFIQWFIRDIIKSES